ncbi:hypothetical protein FSP39_010605, partial [Pinctada imbricata]
PRIACKDERFRKLLFDYCPILSEKFRPTIWCFESRAQTIVRLLVKSHPRITYDSEILVLPDGGQIVLDWYENRNDKFPDPQTRPTVLLLPGLTGSSSESYILHMVKEAAEHGYRSVVFNNRGNGGAKLLTPRTYCAANVEDLKLVIDTIKSHYPAAPVIAVGVSLGGMILFRYLSKMGSACRVEAGMCISVAWNVFESVVELEKPGLNRHVLNRSLAKGLVEGIKQNMHIFDNHVENMEDVLQSTTIREFDTRFTSKMFGYSSCEEYYKDACLHDKIHSLKVPVLVLSAEDDPFSPSHAIPVEEAEQHDNIAIVVTSHGGHIGFMEGWYPRHRTYMDRLYSQYIKAMFTYGSTHLKQD